MSNKEKTLAELVQLKNQKTDKVKALRQEAKTVAKEIRQLQKTIDVSLRNFILCNTTDKSSEDNYGYSHVKDLSDLILESNKNNVV